MYRPGKVMKCGSRDIEIGGPDLAVGTTKRIDLNLGGSASWDTSANQMLPRVNHNLVLLPTGKVLVVGGTAYNNGDTLSAEKRPEIWDPDRSGGSGGWCGRDTLAPQGMIRDYHSTALLLPDGRVLCAGGTAHPTARQSAEIFCPPYLFKAGTANLAVRPAVTGAPSAITWGKSFSLAVPNRSSLTRAALIRPAAVTHGFDQNQRYVPLSYGYADDPTRITVTGPASAGAAPPGHYLLFLTGSGDGPDVPSVARWVRIPTGAGTDTCDRLPPAVLADLAVDAVSTNTAVLTWSATADDSDFAASDAAQEFDLRRSASQINSEGAWGVSTLITGLPTPGEPTTPHDKTVTGLQPCTNYEFAVRARDHNFNQSLLHPRVHVQTLCGGGGGGGYAARQAGAGAAMASAALVSTAATSALPPAPGALIVETSRSASGGWRIVVRGESGAEGLGAADSAGFVFQDRDAAGGWRTRAGYQPDAAEPVIGLCALRERGRVVMPGSHQLRQVASAFQSGDAFYSLATATHSVLGDLSTAIASGGDVVVAQGDSLVLGYEASADSATQDWYALVANGGGGIVPLRAREMAAAEALPLRFALHQNQPNPFAARTTIRFDLPVGAMVRLEVYDVLGRRVSTLANHYYPPGYNAVEWDPRTAAGPGVYFYRIEAGPFRDRRKMVLLP
jgi:hypothetical protein